MKLPTNTFYNKYRFQDLVKPQRRWLHWRGIDDAQRCAGAVPGRSVGAVHQRPPDW
jgi:hypothetical protein